MANSPLLSSPLSTWALHCITLKDGIPLLAQRDGGHVLPAITSPLNRHSWDPKKNWSKKMRRCQQVSAFHPPCVRESSLGLAHDCHLRDNTFCSADRIHRTIWSTDRIGSRLVSSSLQACSPWIDRPSLRAMDSGRPTITPSISPLFPKRVPQGRWASDLCSCCEAPNGLLGCCIGWLVPCLHFGSIAGMLSPSQDKTILAG